MAMTTSQTMRTQCIAPNRRRSAATRARRERGVGWSAWLGSTFSGNDLAYMPANTRVVERLCYYEYAEIKRSCRFCGFARPVSHRVGHNHERENDGHKTQEKHKTDGEVTLKKAMPVATSVLFVCPEGSERSYCQYRRGRDAIPYVRIIRHKRECRSNGREHQGNEEIPETCTLRKDARRKLLLEKVKLPPIHAYDLRDAQRPLSGRCQKAGSRPRG